MAKEKVATKSSGTQMTSAWDAVGEVVKKAKEGGIFLKLEDEGDTFTGAFIGEPMIRRVTFEKNGKKKTQTRVAINVAVIPEEGDPSMKIFEQGPMFFKTLLEVMKKYDLKKWALAITRQGEKGDPQTRYVILPDHEMTKEEGDQVSSLEQHDLSELLEEEMEFDTAKLENGAKKSSPSASV